ncbi:MAG: hypothetical protein L0332_34170 [Chloroflexi bacterium]|nr:hypothetical protein [Chloroflexota bacterium]MCI0581198.1 hypothetical protein [Chloroflexota bacterium]MCI0644122.1 hypothetical protein [Chloroflexota bacterium]MCI0731743.1 hypothetical protein [Chloroflexota bacterium]
MKKEKQEEKAEEAADTTEVTDPIIIELGRHRKKHIERLKEGKGELWYEVVDVLEEIKEQLGERAAGKIMVPVILVYEKRRRRDPLLPF